ncbi:MAG: MSCRAMM family adhesin SdrC, partial [Eubacterium sp.]|nr:MSCRAMM family adhesin SdrC [Eubacterium sp.]
NLDATPLVIPYFIILNNGDGKPDLNIDTTGDGKPNVNIDTNGDGKPDLNIDTTGDGKADTNVDTNGDGIADINLDTDGDGKADANLDTDGDGIADTNIIGAVETPDETPVATGVTDMFSLIFFAGLAILSLVLLFAIRRKSKKASD